MFKRILYGLCVIALLVSCLQETQEYEDTIVVEGWIEAGGSPVVMLSRAFVVTTAEEVSGDQSVVLPWGKVTVSDGVNSAVLTGDYDERYFPPFRYSSSKIRAISVPNAAPPISILGAPKLPKMKTQLEKTLTKNAAMEQARGILTCPTVRRTMVQVRDRPVQI